MPGYFKVPDWVVDGQMRELTHSDFCLLIFYCRVANRRGVSWYAQGSIKTTTGLSLRQISRSMHSLEAQHLITVAKKGNRTRKITLTNYIVEGVITEKPKRSYAKVASLDW